MIWNSDLMETLELTNLMPNALATIVGAAAARRRAAAITHAREGLSRSRDDENWRAPSAHQRGSAALLLAKVDVY